MKRYLAIMAFLFGGFSVEVAKPLHCLLMQASQPHARTRKLRCGHGK